MESELLVAPARAHAAAGDEAGERRMVGGLLVALALGAAWLLVAPSSPDLAAQAYRARLFEAVGFAVWDNNWYGGHHLLGYSLVYPWAAQLLGVRLVGVVALIVSVWAFERVVLAVYGRGARWGALCFALAAAGDLWIGRLTFALGVAFALLAVLALIDGRGRGRGWGRVWLAAGAALLCAASSPVAGLLLALAGVTHMLGERRVRPGIALALAPLGVVLALQALFPEGGWEPFAASSVLVTLAVTLAFVCALPREERLLRRGGLLYGVAALLSLIHAPMGSNVERYGVLLAAPLLLCGLARSGWPAAGRRRGLVVGALCGMLVWVVWGPVRQTMQAIGERSAQASFYEPLRRFLASHGRGPVRIEVPFTRSHWEAALLAPYVALARGWERQLDKRYNAAIEARTLSAAAYERWLRRNAISYVALPDVALDGASVGEGELLRSGRVGYLREALHTAHWRIFEVLDATALASAPGTLVQMGHDSFALRFRSAGVSLVRVRYTPYWTVESGDGCVRPGGEGWTAVSGARAGVVRVVARFSVERALGIGGDGCS